jgi:hypothetical protein
MKVADDEPMAWPRSGHETGGPAAGEGAPRELHPNRPGSGVFLGEEVGIA